METHVVKILSITKVTHDVLQIRTEKPAGYAFVPGQATEVAIQHADWINERRPFTFTSLPSADFLEFTIKTYPAHKGVTNHLLSLVPGDALVVHEVWGAISYKGPGLFIAGGAGVTPFLAIFRQLAQEGKLQGNRLLFANKTKADIIHEAELAAGLGKEAIHVLSDELLPGYRHGFVDGTLLEETLAGHRDHVYVCGPPPMMDAVLKALENLGVGDAAVTVEI
jgi:ferredoxin-NADP reductase